MVKENIERFVLSQTDRRIITYYCGMSALKALAGKDHEIKRLYEDDFRDITEDEREQILEESNYAEFERILRSIFGDVNFQRNRYITNCYTVMNLMEYILMISKKKQSEIENKILKDRAFKDISQIKQQKIEMNRNQDAVLEQLYALIIHLFDENRRILNSDIDDNIKRIYESISNSINSESDYSAFEQKVENNVYRQMLQKLIDDYQLELDYKKENWDKAREHYTAKEIKELNPREQQTAGEQAAECLANRKEYLQAADEYKELYKNPENESKQPEYLVRIGELTMLGGRYPDAIIILQKVNTEYPRTEQASRSYFCLGDYEQHKTIDYDKAVVYYDSSFVSRTISKWGQEARERRDALKRLIAMRNQNDKDRKDSIPNVDNFFKSEFLIAELFLFKLDEVDSAMTRLDAVIESGDSVKALRAFYAKAFIYDEYMHDPDAAEEIYKQIIEKYPDTEYAKQAQVNLGMRVTLKTREDLAKEKYMEAESLWTIAAEMPLDKMDQVDSAYARAFVRFDSLYQEYPETQSGIQALYMKAMYFQMNPERVDSTMLTYKLLRDKYGQTPWGKKAASMMNTRLTITDQDLERLRKRVKSSEEHVNRLSAQYYENLNKAPEEKQAEVKSQEDEILENTYNSMYDFE